MHFFFSFWQDAVKYSAGMVNHALFGPLVPLSVQRLLADSTGCNPFLLTEGVSEKTIDLNGSKTVLFTAEGTEKADKQPLTILYFHGGGFVLGSTDSHRPVCRQLAQLTSLPVYSAGYRLAPEHPFPAAADDAEMAALNLLSQTDMSARRLIIAGDSAGGNLAVVTTNRLMKKSLRPAALLLFSPWVNPADDTLPACFDPVIDAGWAKKAAASYAGDTDTHHPELAPIYADLTGFPPVLLQCGNEEMLLPQIRAFADKLQAAGVKTEFEVIDGLWHSGQTAAAFSPVAEYALDRCAEFVLRLKASLLQEDNAGRPSEKPAPAAAKKTGAETVGKTGKRASSAQPAPATYRPKNLPATIPFHPPAAIVPPRNEKEAGRDKPVPTDAVQPAAETEKAEKPATDRKPHPTKPRNRS